MRIYRSTQAHGVVTRQQLLAAGLSRLELDRELASGTLIRVDRSRVAEPGAHPLVVRSAESGVTLTCLPALALLGVSTPPHAPFHVRRSRYSARTRSLPDGASLCGGRLGYSAAGPVDNLENALRATVSHHSAEEVVTVLDSILHLRLRTRAELANVLETKRGRYLLSLADARSESPLESALRHRLHGRGLKIAVQKQIPGVGRVDLLVGRSLILEADGREFHDTPAQFETDRRRDRAATLAHYIVMRVTARQLFHDWHPVWSDICDILKSRRHLRAPAA